MTSGTPAETKTFSYANANWRDQLTAVNGAAITYDAIGNPLNDGVWAYTWQNGRQLQKMQKSGETVSFAYNENGLRVQKTASSTGVTQYILHGKNIVHLTQGGNSLHFFYDAQNRPAVVVYNGTAYGYVKNLQGDVVAILDNARNKVVEYKYDAWGRPLAKTGSLAASLGKLNPFRYRGYAFDEETGLYYLRSRYYNPIWGRFVNADSLIQQNLFTYCLNSPIIFNDKTGNFSEYPEEYINALEAIYNYSVANKKNPKCITSDELLEKSKKYVGKYPYETYQCAASIAILMKHGASYTGMTTMFKKNILEGTELSIEAIGGQENLIEGMIVAIYDADDEDGRPYNHGGIVKDTHKIYHSTRRHKKTAKNGFYLDDFSNRSWNICGWHKGVIASDRLLEKMRKIIVASYDWTVEEE